MYNIKEFFNKNEFKLLWVLGICSVQYVLMEYSCIPSLDRFFNQTYRMMFLNMFILLTLQLWLKVLFQKWGITMAVSSLIISVWSAVNYYTVLYHGSPLFFSEFRNFTTALDVAGQYNYSIDSAMCKLILLMVIALTMSVILLIFEREELFFDLSRFVKNGICTFACSAFVFVSLFGTSFFKKRNSLTWQWAASVEPNGIISCLIEDLDKTINYLKEPEGYNADQLDKINVYTSKDSGQRPDIILILNETFYDFENYIDTESDVDYMESFYNLENAYYGTTISPTQGGGTNNSEFELLTSNSMYLMQNSAPFNYLDFTKNRNSVAGHLHNLGYTSIAMHCSSKTNYHRHVAYPALGFDKPILGRGHYTHNAYGNRQWLDSDNYQDMIKEYEQMDEGPRFIYLLTYQNHGGYEQNDASFDKVHVGKDFGMQTDDMNEYLTSVQMSCESFKALIEYYKTVDRPVIICMVGDHAPSFIGQIHKEGISETEENLLKQTIPYVIWSNYELDVKDVYTEKAKFIDLVPLILEMADMPMTTYHKTCLDVHNDVPIITSDGMYVDQNGKYGSISKEYEYYEEIRNYYYMEYNALKGGHDYRKELFELK